MRKLWISLLAFSVAASVFGAATDPTKTLRLESNKSQKTVRLSIHEGDYPLVRCYLYQNGVAWTLDGTETAKLSYAVAGWDEATNMVTVAGTVTSNAYVDFQFDSDDTATNGQFYAEIQILDDSPVRAWVWSEVKLEIRKSPIGSAGSLTLDSPPLSTHAALTTTAHSLSTVYETISTNGEGTVGQVFTTDGAGENYWGDAGGGSGDLTAVEVSGGLLTVASGTGPVPIVGLTTAAVQAAQSPEVDTLATVTARGATTTNEVTAGAITATTALFSGLLSASGGVDTAGASILMDGGLIDSENGTIRSGGGVIDSESGTMRSGGGFIDSEGGDMRTGGGDINAEGGNITTTGTNTAAAFVGDGVGITGNIPVSRLNSGTSASATTFWRGDGVWETPAGGGGTRELIQSHEFNPTASGAPDSPSCAPSRRA